MNLRLLQVSVSLAVLIGVLPRLDAVDFQKDIAPILKKNCYECHSEEKKKEKAGEVFDNLKRFSHDIGVNLQIEPGSPANSHFYEVISDPDVKHHMPPKGPLPQADQEKIRKWIEEGAILDKNAAKPGAPLVAKSDLPPIMTWKNAEGVTIKAGFGGIEGGNVVLKMPNGQKVPYPLAKLSLESQQQAKESAGQ
jgi:hypothetical protein